ncbi:MAG: DegV family protein [Clostridia bacterium]|jgi:DegV family protein with EDD domain
MGTLIVTDSCYDLPLSFLEAHQIPVIGLTFTLNGKEYADDQGKSLDLRSFYNAIRQGATPTTSQVNTEEFLQFFKKYLDRGQDILYIAFSSALSGTYNSARIARDMLKSDYPDRTVTVVDSLCASMGQGLLVYKAVQLQRQGYSHEELVRWVEDNKLKINHWFTVDDLNHLKRGGRLSGTSALIGTILDIKPVLHVNDEGRLIPVEKVKGRKKSLRRLVEMLEQRIVDPEEQVVFISHGDALEDAQFTADLIRSKVQVKDILINTIGPIIGSHAGPDTIAVFFFSSSR